jgi:hypothetical protein
MKLLEVAEELIQAQKKLLALHYKYDTSKELSEKSFARFDRLEREVRRLTDLFWQLHVPIHTTNQTYTEKDNNA